MSRVARHLIVTGKVQGVFFRDWTVAQATGLGLDGWVRNLPDGTVEILAAGDTAAVADLIRRAHDGPARAQVDGVTEAPADDPGTTGFARR
ncbi:acylphosphatase [Sphingomonas naphthae]|uniref:Acylphosphatase n=1 Tax=Sphingomonas naphthae TaxID=1813468 RepID=A0ABY7TKP4_9SPHN|nr:acylphosphatase [Sphingomonas naphthae]WCT73523.1 acylphosphatase [Sphingomonas naphthae]